MTDTTHKAPERIWVQHRTCTVDASGASRLLAMDRPFSSATEYVRADLMQAAVAAALTEAAALFEQDALDMRAEEDALYWTAENDAKRILALITPGAQAALDRYVKARQSETDLLRKRLKERFDVLHGKR